jgi:hypothetical protein
LNSREGFDYRRAALQAISEREKEKTTMLRSWMKGAFALSLCAGMALATSARADDAKPAAKPSPAAADHGKPDKPGAKGAEHADKGAANGDKGAEHADKGAEHADKADDKNDGGSDASAAPGSAEKAAKHAAARKARKDSAKAAREQLRKQVASKLKGSPMSTAMREELKHHARRLARLERVKDVADEANDADSVARADKLIEKENARHDKWMAGYDVKAASTKEGAK